MANRSLSAVKVVVQVQATVRNTMDDGSIASGPVNGNISDTIASGISAGEANRAWQWVNHTLASGESGILDLIDFNNNDMGAGDGNDIVGQTMDPIDEIVAILIKNENAEGVAGELGVSVAAVNGFAQIGDHLAIPGSPGTGGGLGPQAVLFKYTPTEDAWLVTASNKRIGFVAIGGAVTYSVFILARHDDDESSSSISTSSSSSSISTSSSSISTSSISTSSSSISTSSISTSSSSNSSSSVSTSSSSQSELP